MPMERDLSVKLLTNNAGFLNLIIDLIEHTGCQCKDGVTFIPANRHFRKRLLQYQKQEWKFVKVAKVSDNEQYIAIIGKNIEQIKTISERAYTMLYG